MTPELENEIVDFLNVKGLNYQKINGNIEILDELSLEDIGHIKSMQERYFSKGMCDFKFTDDHLVDFVKYVKQYSLTDPPSKEWIESVRSIFIVKKKITRPPLGLVPKWVRDEERLKEIKEAIDRYTAEFKSIPSEWVVEYNSLVEIINGQA